MKTSTLVTHCVDNGMPPPHPALEHTVHQQKALSALLRQAYADIPADPPQLAFLAQRVLARAKARPLPPFARAWLAVRAFVSSHPLFAWSSASAAAAFLLALAALPLARSSQAAPQPVHSFVIYQLPGGSTFIRMLEYEQTTSQESGHDHS